MRLQQRLATTFLLSFLVPFAASAASLKGIIPVVGSTAGQNGANFRTELQIHNGSAAEASGRLVLHQFGQPDKSLSYVLAARETKSYEDVVAAMGVTGLGSLDIEVETGATPTVVARAYDDGGANGTKGVSVPVVRPSDAVTVGQTAVVVAPPDTTRARLNVGIRALEHGARVKIFVHRANGTLRSEIGERTYAAHYFGQESAASLLGYVPAADESIAFVVLEGSVVIYGTMTDNVTNDPSIQMAEQRNRVPVLEPIEVTAQSSGTTTIRISAVDLDEENLMFTLAGGAGHGTLGQIVRIDSHTIEITYTPAAGFTGQDSFIIEVSDENGGTTSSTIKVNVGTQQAPTAEDINVTTPEETPVLVTLRGSDPDGDALTFAITRNPAAGSVSAVVQLTPSTARVTYTPRLNFSGTDTFEYQVNDGHGGTDRATVRIVVTEVSDAPTAATNSYTLLEDNTLNVSAPGVLGNDTDPEGDTLSAVLVTTVSNGALVLNANGSFTYTPNANFFGTDSFTYRASDGVLSSATVTVTLTVTPVNDAPSFAITASHTSAEDAGAQSVGGFVTAMSAGPANESGQTLSFNITGNTNPSLFSAGPVILPDGTLQYTAAANANGSATITVVAQDNGGTAGGGVDTSAPLTFTINVTVVDDTPAAVNDAASLNEDAPATAINVLANDTDIDAGPMTIIAVTQGTSGGVVITGGGTGLTYQPAANYCGSDTFTYTLNGGSTATVTVTVACVDDLPVAVNDAATVNEDAPATAINVLANDTDIDAGPISIVSVTQGANGTVVITGGGTGVTYQPNPNYNGSDSFSYTLNGGSTATVTVTVTPVDDPPTASNDAATISEDSGANAIDVLANDTDIDAGPLTVTAVSQGTNGTVVITGGGTGLTYQPNADFCGSDSFTYTLNGGSVATVTVTVTCVDDNPTAVNDAATVSEDSAPNGIDVLANDIDPDGGVQLVTGVTQGTNGTVAITGGGTAVTYTPNADYCGADTFTYTITGGSIGTVNVTVTCVDDNPVAVNDAATVAEDSGANAIAVLANDTDVDAGPLTVTGVTQGTNGSVAITGGGTGVSYTPNANFNGGDSFTYTVNGGSTATVTVTVTPVDDPPTAVNDNASVAEDSGATAINVLANDTDIDGGTNLITGVTQGSNGAVVITGGGTGLTYQPNLNYNGPDSFTYTLNGGSTATVTMTVTPVADPPAVANDNATVNEDAPGTAIDVLANDPDPDNFGKTITSVTQGANGTVVITGGGTGLTYQPNANYCGGDTFTYTINATPALTATVTVTVTCVNDAPSFTTGGDVSSPEDTAYNQAWATGLSKGPADEAGQTLNFVIDTNTNPALFASGPTILPDGTLQYTPAANANGFADITVRLQDDGGTANGGINSSAQVSFKITVTPANDNPTANNDAATVNEDSAANPIDVLANDSIAPDTGETLLITIVTQGANGVVAITGGGTGVTYQPNPNFFGNDSFTYTIADGNGGTAIGTVNVTVNPVNDAPLNTVPGAQSVNQNVTLVFSTGNGNAISIADMDGVAPQVTLSVTNGDLTLSGTTGLSFTAGDGTNDATMTFTGAIVDINNALQGLIYTPVNTFAGGVTLTISTNDLGQTGGGNLIDTDNVAITVNDANDAPVNSLPAAQNVNEDSSLTLSAGNTNAISISDLDAGGNTVQVTLTVTNGTLTLSGTTGLSFAFSDGNGTGAGDGTADATMTFRGTISAINTALNGLVYTPTANFAGAGTLTITTNDLGNTGFGGAQTDSDPLSITVNAVNDGPVNTVPGGQTINEDATIPFNGNVSVADIDADPSPVQITLTATNGTITLGPIVGLSFTTGDGTADATMVFTGTLANVNGALNGMSFTPTAGFSGGASLQISVDDQGNTGGGALTDTDSIAITVNNVNDAPLGTDNAVTTLEDTQYTFTVADFGFSDPNDTPANALLSVVISTLPGAGALQLSGGGFVAGTAITATDINAGNLKFVPAANGAGTPYATFTFRVRDDGGTANGGVDTDPVANTMTVNVTAVNDEPAGTNNTVVAVEDAQYTFTATDFGFTDPIDTPANSLQSVLITTLPGTGSLTLSGSGFVAGTEITLADITAGNLKFAPAANTNGAPYTTFTFQVRDNGGTANSGVDLDASPNTMTVNVTGVNDAPAGTDTTVTTDEDVQFTFTAANFGFTDPNDTPANTLQSVVITTLPAQGSLTLSGGGFVAGTEISLANITAGNLKFLSAPNASGSPYAAFTFQVRDNGGTLNGGVDLDPTPNTMTINVNPVNDAPVAGNESFDTIGNTELRVDLAAGATPNVAESTAGGTGVRENDSDPVEGDPISITSIVGCADVSAPFDCTLASGSVVSMNANGTFSFVPSPTLANGAPTNDSFQYVITDQPLVGVPATATGTVTIAVYDKVWYVKQGAAGGNGTSALPFGNFDSLDGVGGAGDSDGAGDYIFVHHTGVVLPVTISVPLEANQRVLGQGVGLSIPRNLNGNGSPTNLVAAGTAPALTGAADLFTVGNAIPVEIRGLDMTSAAGNAIDVTTSGALTGSAKLTIANNTISGATAEGLDVNLNGGTTGTLQLDISAMNVTSNGTGIDITRNAGTLFITGFLGNTISGNTNGSGIVITGAGAPITFDTDATGSFNQVNAGATSIGASGNPVTGAGLTLANVQGDIAFTNLNIYAGASGLTATSPADYNGTNAGLRLVATNTGDVLSAATGAVVDLTTVTINLTPGTITSNGATSSYAFNLDDVAGTFTAAGSISNISAATTAYRINGSSVNATYNGTINIAQGTGVSLTTNTGTYSFSAALTLTTGANPAFTATSSGTVSSTNTTSTITTTTGTGLNVTSTTIPAAGLTFRSINVDGNDSAPTNAIVLSSTGSAGGLTILGTGSAGTGGTLRDTSGDAISLSNTGKIFLNYMSITSNLGNGIRGNVVNGFSVDNCSITQNGDDAATDDSGINIDELTGTVRAGTHPTKITNSTIQNNFEFQVWIENTTGSLPDFFYSNNTTVDNDGAFGGGGNLLTVLGSGTAAITVDVAGGTFTGSAPNSATGVHLDTGGGTLAGTVTGGTYTNNNAAVSVSTSGTGVLTFDINGVSATGNRAHGLNLFVAATSSGSASGQFRNNIVGTNGVAGSGANLGFGIRVQNESNQGAAMPVTVSITNNTVQETVSFNLINVNQGIASGNASPTQVTITGNTLRNSGARGITIQQNNNVNTTGSAGTMCANISGNTFTGTFVGQAGDGSKMRLRQLAGGTFNVTQANKGALASANTGIVAGEISDAGTINYNGGVCATP